MVEKGPHVLLPRSEGNREGKSPQCPWLSGKDSQEAPQVSRETQPSAQKALVCLGSEREVDSGAGLPI